MVDTYNLILISDLGPYGLPLDFLISAYYGATIKGQRKISQKYKMPITFVAHHLKHLLSRILIAVPLFGPSLGFWISA